MADDESSPAFAFALPLQLKVRAASSDGRHTEINAVITDATGKSVQSLPLTFDGKTPTDEIAQVLQVHVTQIASNLVRRGEAQLSKRVTPSEKTISTLIGRVFEGSVVQ